MKGGDLSRLINRAFPPRSEDPPTEKLWSGIEPRTRPETPSARRIGLPWWMAAATVAAVVTLALMLGQPEPVIEHEPASLTLVLGEFQRADDTTRAWVIKQRPRQWRLNRPAVRALDQAIAETRALLEDRPKDIELQSRIVMYANWRADLLGGLAYERG